MKKIAVIGSGISGNVAAYRLNPHYDVEVFEANPKAGGHANTVTVSCKGKQYDIDTGFIVYNELTYPGLTNLFSELDVKTKETDMGFAVHDRTRDFEYSTSSLSGLSTCLKNVIEPSYWRIWIDFNRFKQEAKVILLNPDQFESWTLNEMLKKSKWNFSERFKNDFLYPLAAAIWSMPEGDVDGYPAVAILKFLMNHRMLDVVGQPVWRTVEGGSREYVNKLTKPFRHRIHMSAPVDSVRREKNSVLVTTQRGESYSFDEVVFATHSNHTLKMIENPSELEKEILGSVAYLESEAILHTDSSVLAKRPKARSSWNVDISNKKFGHVRVSYNMSQLQHIQSEETFCVSLNMKDQIKPECIYSIHHYAHPFFNQQAIRAQKRWGEISGVNRFHFCGAYWRWGFHEDGLWSADRVVDYILSSEKQKIQMS